MKIEVTYEDFCANKKAVFFMTKIQTMTEILGTNKRQIASGFCMQKICRIIALYQSQLEQLGL